VPVSVFQVISVYIVSILYVSEGISLFEWKTCGSIYIPVCVCVCVCVRARARVCVGVCVGVGVCGWVGGCVSLYL
jgi:hypothetical protein